MSKDKHRKLAAVMFCDIQGYTALMQKDELTANRNLEKFHQTLNEKVSQYKGQIINNYGDGCVCTFDSAVDAMHCAKDAQTIFQTEPKVPVRIGLHSGDVFFKDNNVFGDSVNIASRIESLGVAGAVLFSKQIKRHIANQTAFEVQPLGSFHFKNVEKTMEVFALANKGLIIPKKSEVQGKGLHVPKSQKSPPQWLKLAGMALVLAIVGTVIWNVIMGDNTFKVSPTITATTNKSIAVLPFENFNKDPEQQYFSDGISQDILTHLSGIKDLTVISFNSSKQYRNSEKSSKEIGTSLGVQHLLSGSVHQSGDNLRIRAMLINAVTDQQLWAKRFDKKLEDIFQIQSKVSEEIAEVLKAELLPPVASRIKEKPTENLAAWQEYSQGRYLWNQRGVENLKAAEKHFLKAIQLDTNFALAYAGVAQINGILGVSKNYQEGMGERLTNYAEKAIALNPNTADAFAALGVYHRFYKCNFSKSTSFLNKAIVLEPGNADARQWLALTYFFKGDIENARIEVEIAQRLDPASKIIQLMSHNILLGEDKYIEALEQLEQFYKESPAVDPIKGILTDYYIQFGMYEKAKSLLSNSPSSMYRELMLNSKQQKLDKIRKMQSDITKNENPLNKKRLSYFIENELLLLSGNLEEYIARVDSSIFMLGYDTTMPFQQYPPPDSIRLHPKFQEMMQKRDFTVRPRSPKLKAIKHEH